MPIRRLSLIAVTVAAIASSAFAAPPLTAQGWGKLRIGMRERDAVRLFHLRVPRSLGADSFDCRQDEMPSQEGMAVMAQRGIITRITIAAPSQLLTDRHLGLSSTEADVKRAYGKALRIETTPYEAEPAHEMTFWSVPGKRGVRYDTNIAGSVEAIYVGASAIELIEGCS
jgi:hypothetical protein